MSEYIGTIVFIVGLFFALLGIYFLQQKIHTKKVRDSLLKWSEGAKCELISFRRDPDHAGPFIFDTSDNKPVYIVQYKDQDGKLRSGYALYGEKGLGISGRDIVFEPIDNA